MTLVRVHQSQALDELEARWGDLYPIVIKLWRTKWENLSAYFKYPPDIRRIIYTTNSIEAVHRQFRKLTKTKGGFPNENSLMKLFYLGVQNASKKWTMPIQNWNVTLSQLAIFFEENGDRLKLPQFNGYFNSATMSLKEYPYEQKKKALQDLS